MLRLCAAVLMVVYAEYRFWDVTQDGIAYAHEVGVHMSIGFGSLANVGKILELSEIIESTRFEQLPSSWRGRTSQTVDHHLGRTGAGSDFLYYDTWKLRNIDEMAARSRVSASRIGRNDVNVGCVHDEDEKLRVPRDTGCSSVRREKQKFFGGNPAYLRTASLYSGAMAQTAATMVGTSTMSSADCVYILRKFFEDIAILSSTKGVMSIVEIFANLHGRWVR